jgi:16S rRNA processing protein RimM
VSDNLITVGKLGRTRGVEGEIYITPFTDFPDRFLELDEVFVKIQNGWEKMKLVSSRLVVDRPVIRFENVNNPEQAARLTNRIIAVPKDQLVKLPKDMFYIFELIGCHIYSEADNSLLGEIIDVEQYPANDVYLIKIAEDKIIRFPAVKQFVKSVDIDNKKIVVDPAGFIDQ